MGQVDCKDIILPIFEFRTRTCCRESRLLEISFIFVFYVFEVLYIVRVYGIFEIVFAIDFPSNLIKYYYLGFITVFII